MVFFDSVFSFSFQGPLGSPQPSWPPASRIMESLPPAVGSLTLMFLPNTRGFHCPHVTPLQLYPNLDSHHLPTCTNLH